MHQYMHASHYHFVDFDALPCVQVLQTVPEFLSLSIDDIIKVVRDNLSLMKPSLIHLSGAACQLREEVCY